jgi:hypothetical protein
MEVGCQAIILRATVDRVFDIKCLPGSFDITRASNVAGKCRKGQFRIYKNIKRHLKYVSIFFIFNAHHSYLWLTRLLLFLSTLPAFLYNKYLCTTLLATFFLHKCKLIDHISSTACNKQFHYMRLNMLLYLKIWFNLF